MPRKHFTKAANKENVDPGSLHMQQRQERRTSMDGFENGINKFLNAHVEAESILPLKKQCS